jgi:Glycosyl hydrolase family 26
MKPRPSLITVLAVILAAVSVVFAAARLLPKQSDSHPVVHAVLTPNLASYLGVYEPGEPRYQPIADFTSAINRQPNLVESFSGWADRFDSAFAESLHRRGVTLLIQIDPTDASVAAIAQGVYDDYLELYAESVADFGYPVVIGFGHEMNANWYSWGYGHVSPATFVAAWQHVVTIFRDKGADNVTWLWTIQAYSAPGSASGAAPKIAPANEWWPGPQYVTWVGIDNFYYKPTDRFAKVFGRTIADVRRFAPSKPVLLSETAVGPGPEQVSNILDLFRGVIESKALGLVWFDVNQHAGIFHQDWRIEGNGNAENAFSLGVRRALNSPASP